MSIHCTCCTNELLDIHEENCHSEVPLITSASWCSCLWTCEILLKIDSSWQRRLEYQRVSKIHVRSWVSRANLTIDKRRNAKISQSFVIFSRKHEYKFLFEIASYRANENFNFNFNFKALRCHVFPLLPLLKFCVRRRLNQCGSIMRNSSPCIVQKNHETMLKLTLSAATRNPTAISVRWFLPPPFDN